MIIRTREPFASFHILNSYIALLFLVERVLKTWRPYRICYLFETSIFAAVTLMMSNFSTTTIAAHQAAMNFASLLYMTPLSLAMAMTISVGFEVERNDIITQNNMDLSGLA